MAEEIIKNIHRNLSGNPDLDMDYLISQMEFYKGHEKSYYVIKEISRLMWENLSSYEEEFLIDSKDITEVAKMLDEVIPLIEDRDRKTALEKLDRFFDKFNDKYENEDTAKGSDFNTNRSIDEIEYTKSQLSENPKEYHSFLNPLEEIMFYHYIGLRGEMNYIPFNEPLFDLYYLYGCLLVENDRFVKAEEILKKALKINPVSSKTLLELVDIYKSKTRTYNRFFLLNVDALKYAYSNEDIARAYRNFGFFYVEENQLEVAAAFYHYSLNFDFNIRAFREIEYIKSRHINTEMSDEDIERIIRSKHIQIGVNPFILDTLKTICIDLDNRNYKSQALYFYRIYFELTKDDWASRRIYAIQNKI